MIFRLEIQMCSLPDSPAKLNAAALALDFVPNAIKAVVERASLFSFKEEIRRLGLWVDQIAEIQDCIRDRWGVVATNRTR